MNEAALAEVKKIKDFADSMIGLPQPRVRGKLKVDPKGVSIMCKRYADIAVGADATDAERTSLVWVLATAAAQWGLNVDVAAVGTLNERT